MEALPPEALAPEDGFVPVDEETDSLSLLEDEENVFEGEMPFDEIFSSDGEEEPADEEPGLDDLVSFEEPLESAGSGLPGPGPDAGYPGAEDEDIDLGSVGASPDDGELRLDEESEDLEGPLPNEAPARRGEDGFPEPQRQREPQSYPEYPKYPDFPERPREYPPASEPGAPPAPLADQLADNSANRLADKLADAISKLVDKTPNPVPPEVEVPESVITSYSIHYTKLYES